MKPLFLTLFMLLALQVVAQETSEEDKRHNSLLMTASVGSASSKSRLDKVGLDVFTPRATLFQIEYNFRKYDRGVYFSTGFSIATYNRKVAYRDVNNIEVKEDWPLQFYAIPLTANIPIKLYKDLYIINQLSAMPALAYTPESIWDNYHVDVTFQYALLLNYKMAVVGFKLHHPFTAYSVHHSPNVTYNHTGYMFTLGVLIGG